MYKKKSYPIVCQLLVLCIRHYKTKNKEKIQQNYFFSRIYYCFFSFHLNENNQPKNHYPAHICGTLIDFKKDGNVLTTITKKTATITINRDVRVQLVIEMIEPTKKRL